MCEGGVRVGTRLKLETLGGGVDVGLEMELVGGLGIKVELIGVGVGVESELEVRGGRSWRGGSVELRLELARLGGRGVGGGGETREAMAGEGGYRKGQGWVGKHGAHMGGVASIREKVG